MKKRTFFLSLAMATMLAGCGTQMGNQVLSDILLGQGTTGDAVGTLGNILGSVLKTTTTPTQKQLIGSWTYY